MPMRRPGTIATLALCTGWVPAAGAQPPTALAYGIYDTQTREVKLQRPQAALDFVGEHAARFHVLRVPGGCRCWRAGASPGAA
jgi:hypothetical protein